MAEELLFNVAGEIIKKLGSVTLKEIGLWWGVKEELENLKNTVSLIQAVLLDAEEQQKQNNQVKDWLRKLKDAVYDADDLLDDFSTEALRQRLMIGNKVTKKILVFFSSSNQLVYGIKMSHKIKAIRERLVKIADDMRNFHLNELPSKNYVENREWRQTYSFVLEEEVIGRENDKEKIIKLLLESNEKENVSFIPIVGLGGLGKTTLAQLAFNDERAKTHFDLKMWVCVSVNFEVQTIGEKILKCVTGGKLEKLEMETLQSNLRKEIDGKKYLLVLDDMWNENQEKWQRLRSLLMGGARGSKIVVTTRSQSVAEIIGTVSPYRLEGLSDSQSWSLLKKTSFKHQEQESIKSELVKIGMEIAKKCVGVPLAIKTIGSVLYFKRTELEWLQVLNNELSTITQQENDILPILKLSYDHLPSHLKQCFAYCSLFPKDYVIDKQTLINLWMAQGFIQSPRGDQQLEDVGYEYLMDMVWRSFFREIQEDKLGNVESCKMHDLMHDLARLVAGTECTMINLGTENVYERARHVSFGYKLDSSQEIPTGLLEANKVRTIQSHGWLKKSNCNTIVSTCKCLRALDLGYSKIKLSPSIGELKHLRYLGLSENYEIRRLPSSISRLHNLQTLNLSGCPYLVELPRDIRKMVSLRHLRIEGCYGLTVMPKGLGQLTCLRTLPLFIVGKRYSGLTELNGLNNLRGELEIVNLENTTSSKSRGAKYLKEKLYLQSLKLMWSFRPVPCYDDEVILEGLEPHPNLKRLRVDGFSGVRFCSWLSSLTNIVEIRLESFWSCQHLPALDELPSLTILHLKDLIALECITSSRSRTTAFFPSLKELHLSSCRNLKGWWKNDDGTTLVPELPSFPCLSKLRVSYCPRLTSMPLYPSLEEDLYLRHTSWKPLQQTMKMEMMMTSATPSTSSSSSSSSSYYPLSRLKSLHLEKIEDLEFLPEEGLRNLTSLQSLSIFGCPKVYKFCQLRNVRSCQNEAAATTTIGPRSLASQLFLFRVNTFKRRDII